MGTAQLNTLIQKSNEEYDWAMVKPAIDFWCNIVNSIQYKFTERKALINLPKFDLNMFKQSLSGFKTGVDL